MLVKAYTKTFNLSYQRAPRQEKKPRYGRLRILKNFRVGKNFYISWIFEAESDMLPQN